MKAEDERIKQILVGLELHTVIELDDAAHALHVPRSQIMREAVGLWLKAYELKKKETSDGNSNPSKGSTS